MGFVSNYEAVRDEITRYARVYIQWCRARDLSYAKIGERLGVSHSWAKQLDGDEHGTKKIGPDVELALTRLLHGGSIDNFRAAAHHMASGATVHVRDELTGEVIELPERSSGTMHAAPLLLPGRTT
jgi:hypothetical protein